MSIRDHSWFHLGITLIVSGLFLYAGVVKLWNLEQFLVDVESYRIFPYAMAVCIVYFMPVLEIVCAVGLWVPQLRQGSRFILLLLMTSFLVLICISWARGIDISCGCFGEQSGNKTNYPWLVFRDVVILGLVWKIKLTAEHAENAEISK